MVLDGSRTTTGSTPRRFRQPYRRPLEHSASDPAHHARHPPVPYDHVRLRTRPALANHARSPANPGSTISLQGGTRFDASQTRSPRCSHSLQQLSPPAVSTRVAVVAEVAAGPRLRPVIDLMRHD